MVDNISDCNLPNCSLQTIEWVGGEISIPWLASVASQIGAFQTAASRKGSGWWREVTNRWVEIATSEIVNSRTAASQSCSLKTDESVGGEVQNAGIDTVAFETVASPTVAFRQVGGLVA